MSKTNKCTGCSCLDTTSQVEGGKLCRVGEDMNDGKRDCIYYLPTVGHMLSTGLITTKDIS